MTFTVTGRFSCKQPTLCNLPRPMYGHGSPLKSQKPPLYKKPGGLKTFFKLNPCWCVENVNRLLFEPAYHGAMNNMRKLFGDAFVLHAHGPEFHYTVAFRRSDGFYVPYDTKSSRSLDQATSWAMDKADGKR